MSGVLPFQRGFVSLVGAGPGHPDLLTIRGLRALQAAEVILTDALLDPSFAALFPAPARVVFVGKRCGDHALRQKDINDLIIREARKGQRVVRLKGGDPFVFGRGGEEALALREAGIPFEIIPGVSALNGVAAAAAIPLTHRGLSKELRVIEGHTARSVEAWQELAAYRGTLAIFMGSGTLGAMAQKLLDQGAPADWPVALVEHGCTERQEVSRGSLRDAACLRLMASTDGPGLVLMGPTVPLHDLLSFSSGASHVSTASPLSQARRPAGTPRGRRERRAG